MAEEVQIYNIEFEGGAGTRGASLGPKSLIIADLDAGSKIFKKTQVITIPSNFDYLYEKVSTKYAARITHIIDFLKKIISTIDEHYVPGKHFPIFIGGDHSITIGTYTGVIKKIEAKNPGIIWIDAHADFHSPYTTPSGNIHGMVLAAITGRNHLNLQINDVDQNVAALWNELINIGGFSPKVNINNVIYVGLRSFEPQEKIIIDTHKIKVYTVQDMETIGADRIAIEIQSALTHCDAIYVSFDVDAIDPLIARGTGTPVPNGLRPHHIRDLLIRLINNSKVVALDIVEINPTFDVENYMAEDIIEILNSIVNVFLY